ncbi:DUF1573 domain-containing protein [Proteiniphilum saccharofermentans]|uniref:DUF1573 domain-containing protein n=1 Tax=Proteiniphilum saccharofermentans TaxID=1642647 RepID=UPI0028A6841C|nr:DUF1573 domain-containing protein [Proteiniphilum saccharofermentans]
MSNTIYSVWVIFFLVTGSVSCRKDTKKAEVEKIVTEWTGKEIVFPADIPCSYLGRDTVCPEWDTPYKILLYTDSTGCTDCKLQLYKWNAIIEEAETMMPGKVSFHFYFQPKDEKELEFMLRRDNFKQAVYMDRQNKLYEANKLPDNMSYQCFLLDKDDKVRLIGNPTLNPKIWDLYKQIIMGEENARQEDILYTTVEIEQAEIELQDTQMHETATAIFVLKNTGDVPLLIKDISASCGCTIPEWDKKPIKPGEKTEIKVKVTPDGTGYFRKTVTVFCNTKRGAIPLSVKSTVKG